MIKENFNNVDINFGTIEKQYSGAISENYGNVGTIGESASIEKLYDGTITENSGNVVIYPAPEGILTTVRIVSNKKSVRIEADPNGKSSVVIDKNESGATLYVCEGAECTVIDNAGTIEIEAGGVCNIKGANSGVVTGETTNPGEGYDCRLIFDNVDISDITFVDFFKKDGDNIYVMNEGPDRNLILSYDMNKYYYPEAVEINGLMCIEIKNSDYSILDDANHTFTLHFHTMGEYVHSSGEKHKRKCGGNWNGSECTATFYEESCSLIPATCTNKAKCEKCGTEYGSMEPHSYTWERGDGKHKQVCSQCGDIMNSGDCSFGEWIIDSEAKVGVEGQKHRVCSVCNGVENATIPAKTDSGNKKNDKRQGGNEQDTTPTKEDDLPVINPAAEDVVKNANPAKKSTAQAVKTPSKNDVIQKEDSADTDVSGETENNSDGRDEEPQTVDSVDTASDSEAAVDDSESSEQAMAEIEDTGNAETLSVSGDSKIGLIVGIAACATAAATIGFVILSRKRGHKNLK